MPNPNNEAARNCAPRGAAQRRTPQAWGEHTGGQAIAILVGALGGQGGGVLAEWLVQAATRAGYAVQSTSIPGVAQRTGATTYYVEIYPRPLAALRGRMPVLGLYPVPAQVDVVIASELLEAGRMLHAGYVTPDRTLLVTSTSRTLTTAEKMALGDGRFSSDRLLETARRFSRHLFAFDMDAIARDAGTVVSSVMLGAIAGGRVLPIARSAYTDVVRATGVGVEGSLRGFDRGFAAVTTGIAAHVTSTDAARESSRSAGTKEPMASSGPTTATTQAGRATHEERTGEIVREFPGAAREMIAQGYRRVVEFQDARYGDLYVERLRVIANAGRTPDPTVDDDARVLRETARFLALWMAFDDIIRVASLKSRAARYARVRSEIGAGRDDVIRIFDYFKPGVPEFAGMLPPTLARRLVAWDKRRQARGRDPLAWALHLRSHSIHGVALLRMLAALRGVRRFGARYRDEQCAIERWLRAIEDACAQSRELAYEIALCGRLIKGYGATNERGKANLAHMLDHLLDRTSGQTSDVRAAAICAAREAALADEGGKALDVELARHGAPPRPVMAQPIRWAPRRTTGAQSAKAH